MNTTTALAITAATFGVGMGAAPLLQAIKSHKSQSANDVSLPFLFILLAGGAAWLAYGIAILNPAIIVCNSVGVLSSATAIIVTMRWRRGSEAQPASKTREGT